MGIRVILLILLGAMTTFFTMGCLAKKRYSMYAFIAVLCFITYMILFMLFHFFVGAISIALAIFLFGTLALDFKWLSIKSGVLTLIAYFGGFAWVACMMLQLAELIYGYPFF